MALMYLEHIAKDSSAKQPLTVLAFVAMALLLVACRTRTVATPTATPQTDSTNTLCRQFALELEQEIYVIRRGSIIDSNGRMPSDDLKKLASGALDRFVGDGETTYGGSAVWKSIKDGIPVMLKQGPGGKFFNGKENEHFEGVMHTLQEWTTDARKLEFLGNFGWLMKDVAVQTYSALFKPKK